VRFKAPFDVSCIKLAKREGVSYLVPCSELNHRQQCTLTWQPEINRMKRHSSCPSSGVGHLRIPTTQQSLRCMHKFKQVQCDSKHAISPDAIKPAPWQHILECFLSVLFRFGTEACSRCQTKKSELIVVTEVENCSYISKGKRHMHSSECFALGLRLSTAND